MDNARPIFDPGTHYRIKVQGGVNVEWLQSFEHSAGIGVGETKQIEDITVLNVHTDQSGIVGLLRKMHGLGITILQFQMITGKEK